MNVRSVLAAKGHDVVTISPDARILDAANLMRRCDIGSLVVTDAHGDLLGLLTEREVSRGFATCGYRLVDMRVAQVMERSVLTSTPDEDVLAALALLTRGRTRHLPVLEDGRLCGIVTLADLAKHRLQNLELEVQVLRDLHLAHWGSDEPRVP